MLPISEPYLDREELKNVTEAVRSGWISYKGKFVKEFEDSFSKYVGMKYGVACSHGTNALHLALAALGISRGDEVIVPSLTYIATANAATYLGAKPVFIDSHPEYWCIDPEKIEEKITRRTKAIIPVHLYGHPCDMDMIQEIAERHDLRIVEDAAEAHGALYKGRRTGSLSDISCFSFSPIKTITTGEGGMCMTNNKELAESMRTLIEGGVRRGAENPYYHEVLGFNYLMTNLQAAVGVAQVKKLDRLVGRKRKTAKIYRELLEPLETQGRVVLQREMPWKGTKSSCWAFVILVDPRKRDHLRKRLLGKGMETRPVFVPMDLQPIYKTTQSANPRTNPVAKGISERGVMLPNGPRITEEHIEGVARAIKGIL